MKDKKAAQHTQFTGHYGKSVEKKERLLVSQGQLIGQVCTIIEIATGGIETDDDSCNGYLLAVSENLNDDALLQEVSSTSNFAGEIRAALLMIQKVRFVPNEQVRYGPPPKRPSECLSMLSKKVRDTFAEVGLAEPSTKDILAALEQYRVFNDKEIAEFRSELEGK